MGNKSDSLTSMPNIGKVLAAKLEEAGIHTPQQLVETGSRDAFLRIKVMHDNICLCHLMALEAAAQGIRWHNLDAGCKQELKEFHRSAQLK